MSQPPLPAESAVPAPPAPATRFARLRPWLSIGVFILALVFLGALLASQWRQLQSFTWRIEPLWAGVALLLLWLTWLLELNQWRFILTRLGGPLAYGQAARIWFFSNIIRYIPGNVWQFLGMSELCAAHGIPRTATFTSIALHQAISTLAGLLLAAFYFALMGQGVWFDRLRPALWLAPLGLLGLHPRILETTLNWALARLKRPPLRIVLTLPDLARLFAAYLLVWIGFGLGFSALTRSLTPLTPAQIPWLIAGYAAAYVIGYLSLLTPSGLGVREGALVLLLHGLFAAPLPTVIAIVARLWMIGGEVGGALAAGLTRRTTPAIPASHDPISPAAHRSNSNQLLVVVLLSALYIIGFSILSIRPHDALRTHMADLGQIDLAIWNTSQGRFVQEVKDGLVSTRLTDHVEPIFAPLSLVFYLWNDVRALLVLQTIAIAGGALILFALARDLLPPAAGRLGALLPVALAAAYLLTPALQAANLTEFHAIPFAAAPILFAFWRLQRSDHIGFAVACLLLASVKEEAALLACALGCYAIWRQRRTWRQNRAGLGAGLGVALGSIVWFYLATFIIIPQHAAEAYGVEHSVYFARYGALGDSPLAIVKSFFTQPALVWQIAIEPARLAYLAGLLAPFGFLSLLAPEILLLSAPLLIANLFSAYPAQFSGEFHYSAPLVPFIAVAALFGVRRLLARRRRAAGVICAWLLFWALVYQGLEGYTPLGREFSWPQITPHARLLTRFADQVPPDAPGSVTTALYPHFSHREKLYKFPIVADAAWALIDVTGVTDRHPAEIQRAVLGLIAQGWQVADAADGFVLLQQPTPGVPPRAECPLLSYEPDYAKCTLPDAFFDFARADRSGLLTKPPALSSAPLVFGERLNLLGHELVDDGKWGLTRWRSFWQTQAPLPTVLRVWPFAVAPDGSLADDPALRPPVVTLWYPPARWQPGEQIVVETLPWFMPPVWAPAVGVYAGEAWADQAGRWPVQGAAAAFEQQTWARLTPMQRVGRRLLPLPGPAAEVEPLAVFETSAGAPWIELHRLEGLPAVLTAGGAAVSIPLTLTWRLAAPVAGDWSVFVHLRNAAGDNVAQADGPPVWFGLRPFTAWKPDQPGADRRNLSLPRALAPGIYRLVIGLYDPQSGQRLTLTHGANETEVGRLHIAAPKP